MGFLDPLIKALRAPLDAIRGQQAGVSNLKGGIKGDLARAKDLAGQYGGAAKDAAGKAKGAGATKLPTGAKAKKKMGLFGKKKKCGSCGEKLHPSWDQCPYCGAGGEQPAAAAPPAPSHNRTVALDMGASAGGHAAIGWLVPLEGEQTGELFQLKGRCVVGTAPDCDVVLKDASISGRHAEFVAGAGGYRINDLGSTNGTYVNDKRVSSHDLVDNDNVRLGRTNYKFKSMS